MWLFALYLPSFRVKMMPLVLVLFGRLYLFVKPDIRILIYGRWHSLLLSCIVWSPIIAPHIYCPSSGSPHLASLRRVCQFKGIFDTSIVAQGVIIIIIVIIIVWISLSKLGLVMMPPRFLSPFHSSLEVSSLLYLSYICNVFVLCCIVFVMFFKCICNVFVCFSLFSGSQFSTVLYRWSILYCPLIIFVMCICTCYIFVMLLICVFGGIFNAFAPFPLFSQSHK